MGGGQNLPPPPCVFYPKDPMWNRVNYCNEPNKQVKFETILILISILIVKKKGKGDYGYRELN